MATSSPDLLRGMDSEQPSPDLRESAHAPTVSTMDFPPHDFRVSEFAPDSGKCDICGLFADAPVHTYVDPQVRIATALEFIAQELYDTQSGILVQVDKSTVALEQIAANLDAFREMLDTAGRYAAAYLMKFMPEDWQATLDEAIEEARAKVFGTGGKVQ